MNNARFVFLNPHASEFYVDWESVANDTVATLRAAAGRDLFERCLSDLVGELSTRSEAFRTRWAAHNVRFHRTGVKRLHRPIAVTNLLIRSPERDLLPLCRARGIAVVPYNPLAGGMLTGKYRRGEEPPEGTRFAREGHGPMYRARYWSGRMFDVAEAVWTWPRS